MKNRKASDAPYNEGILSNQIYKHSQTDELTLSNHASVPHQGVSHKSDPHQAYQENTHNTHSSYRNPSMGRKEQ